jgi:regulator of sigma E protease
MSLESHESGQPNPDLNRPSDPTPEPPEPAPEPTLRQWLAQNGFMLVLLAAGVVYLYMKFDTEGLWAIAKAALGLGFVIFIHELGHFLVAKWCDVHVQVFSIGFGPALPGCSFTWGETTYKLAVFPLGGYVQMVGQVDGDESADGSEDDPRSYRNKGVWQRMAIISAGVTMNAILAILCFVIVFQGPGKDRKAGVVAQVDSGSPAFRKGIPTGAEILQIGEVPHPYFEELMVRVMATTKGESLLLKYQVPGQAEHAVEIEPRLNKDDLRPLLGIGPAHRLELLPKRYAGKAFDGPVFPGTAAARATPAFAFGDRIIAMTDPADPKEVTPLPLDPRKPGSDQRDYFAFERRMRELAGKEVTLRVLRKEGREEKKVDIHVPPAYHHVLGARMEMGQITVVQENSPATRDPANRVHPRDPVNNLEGDVIQKVLVHEPDGSVTTFLTDLPMSSTPCLGAPAPLWALSQGLATQLGAVTQKLVHPGQLDPERLPDQLRQWAGRMAKAPHKDWHVTLYVRRHNPPDSARGHEQYTTDLPLQLEWNLSATFQEVAPLYAGSPMPIPELGLGYQVRTTVAGVIPDLAGTGENALQPGDVIEKVQFSFVAREGETPEKSVWTPLEADQWAWIFHLLQSPPEVQAVALQVKRNKEAHEFTVTVRPDRSWPLAERGLFLDYDVRVQKANGIFEAIGMGLKDTYGSMMQVYQNLRGMLTGRISPKNLGGPVTIARVAYSIAGVDFWEFIFFLGLISINLAVINFLPIPVLDGGHMVFLMYEKVRGRPASEQVRVGATYAGLLLLASLMIFVLYLDISRLL